MGGVAVDPIAAAAAALVAGALMEAPLYLAAGDRAGGPPGRDRRTGPSGRVGSPRRARPLQPGALVVGAIFPVVARGHPLMASARRALRTSATGAATCSRSSPAI